MIIDTPHGKMKVNWMHFRDHRQLERGTWCIMENEDGTEKVTGRAHLSNGDMFCKRKGRKISFTRAVRVWSRGQRTGMWAQYCAQMPGDFGKMKG